MRFRRIVKNKKVIAIVLATVMAFVAVLTSCNHNQKHSNNKHKTNIAYQNKQRTQQRHVKLVPRTTYHTQGNVYIQNGKHMKVSATAYTNDPITATGTKPTEGRTIAVDPKVIPYGTKVYIPQFDRVFIAEDCGSAIKGNRIDIYMNDYDRCMDWGIKTIDIYIINE